MFIIAERALLVESPRPLSALLCGIMGHALGCDDVAYIVEAKTGLEGKFSIEYCVAAALADRKVTVAATGRCIPMSSMVSKASNGAIRVLYPSESHFAVKGDAEAYVEIRIVPGETIPRQCPQGIHAIVLPAGYRRHRQIGEGMA